MCGCKHLISCYSEWQYTGLGGYKHWKAILVYRCTKKNWLVKGHTDRPSTCTPRRCNDYSFGTHPLEEGNRMCAMRYELRNPNRFKGNN